MKFKSRIHLRESVILLIFLVLLILFIIIIIILILLFFAFAKSLSLESSRFKSRPAGGTYCRTTS